MLLLISLIVVGVVLAVVFVRGCPRLEDDEAADWYMDAEGSDERARGDRSDAPM